MNKEQRIKQIYKKLLKSEEPMCGGSGIRPPEMKKNEGIMGYIFDEGTEEDIINNVKKLFQLSRDAIQEGTVKRTTYYSDYSLDKEDVSHVYISNEGRHLELRAYADEPTARFEQRMRVLAEEYYHQEVLSEENARLKAIKKEKKEAQAKIDRIEELKQELTELTDEKL